MNLTQLPDDHETTTPASANSVSITHSTLTNSLSKKKRQHLHKDLNKQHKLIHQLIQPPLDDDDEDEESDQQENEESTEEQLALYEFKTHKKMKLNNGEEHTISDTDEQNKYEEDTEEEEDDDDEESQESCSSSQTPPENEEQLNNCHLLKNQPEGQEKEVDKKEHKDQGNPCDSMDQSEEEEDNDEEGEDEDYVVTEEDLAQHRNDKVLNCLWSEEALKKLEIDELDEPIDEQSDVEGFDIEEVMNDEKKKKYIENLMECLPPYMYCITPEDKQLFFEKLNKEFQHNLEEADTHVPRSHEKKVNFDFASAQVIEFDLNKKVKNISKLPILKGVEDVSAI